MSQSFKEIKRRARALSIKERADLAHELISSLDEVTDYSDDSEWENEIKKRVEEIKSGKANGRPAIDILAEIRTKYS
ncbi:MAG: addiction module protein [Calditrichia bacterium]|nr:addiction module protein [Calditrichia bacterium]